MNLSPMQGQAVKAVEDWLMTDKQEFLLWGYAGTGKTTLAKYIKSLVRNCMYMAFTGKASLVLQQKGCTPSSTIHSAIYTIDENSDEANPKWVLNKGSIVQEMDLIIVDEGPMVGELLATDLLKLAKKVLVLGDPGQLPPVNDKPFWSARKPDFLLTEIHRQAAENPIIALSMIVREQGFLKVGDYGDCKVIRAKNYKPEMMFSHDQILCGKNDTRHYYNQQYRAAKEYGDLIPREGEKLICLRNNRERGFLNGSMWIVKDARDHSTDVLSVIVPDWDVTQPHSVISTPKEYFEGLEHTLDPYHRRTVDEFCYAYAITTHKAQGSQWPSVLVLDQSKVFREDAHRWLYTAITRAEDRITVMVN